MKVVPVKDRKGYEDQFGVIHERKRDAEEANRIEARVSSIKAFLSANMDIAEIAGMKADQLIVTIATNWDDLNEILTEEE